MAIDVSGGLAGYYHDVSALDNGTTSSWVVSARLRLKVNASFERIIHQYKQTNLSTDSVQLIMLDTNRLAFVRNVGSVADEIIASTDVFTGTPGWIHVLASVKFGVKPKLWINGVPQSNSTITGLGLGSNNARLYIGGRSDQSAAVDFTGDFGPMAHWITADSSIPEPTDEDAVRLYRGDNPWSFAPDKLVLVRNLNTVDEPPIFNTLGASVKYGTPAQATSHPPITRSDVTFIGSVVGGGVTPTNLNIGSGSIAASGLTAGLSASANLSPSLGAVSLAGRPVTLLETVQLMVSPGGIIAQGQDIGLSASSLVQPGLGSMSLGGQAVGLESSVEISPNVGSGSFSGSAVGLEADVVINPAFGTMTINGFSVGVSSGDLLEPGTGLISVAGQNLSLIADTLLDPTLGSVALSGQPVTVTSGEQLSPGVGGISASGLSVTLIAQTDIEVGLGGITAEGLPMDLAFGVTLQPVPGVIGFEGQPITLNYDTTLAAAVGALAFQGMPVTLNAITFYVDNNLIDIPLNTSNVDLVLKSENLDF